MARDDLLQVEGEITDMLAGGNYKVKLETGQEITAKLSGKMKKFYIKVIVGDFVTCGLSPYDLSHGLITFRHKGKPKPKTDADPTSSSNRDS